MRRSEEPGAITRGAADRVEQRADRAFSIRAGDMNDPLVRRGNTQRSEEPAAVLEPKLNAKTLGAEKPGERFPVIRADRISHVAVIPRSMRRGEIGEQLCELRAQRFAMHDE